MITLNQTHTSASKPVKGDTKASSKNARMRVLQHWQVQLHVREERIVELLVQVQMSKKEQEMYVGCFVKRFLFDDLC